MGTVFTIGRALGMATGEFIYSGAADDFILPGFFEKSMALLTEHPEAGLCCSIADWRELHTGLHWHMGVGMTDKPAHLPPERLMELERRGRLFIAGHTVIVKRTALFEAGRFPEAVKYASDWYTYNLIAFKYGICVVPEALAVCEITPNTYYQRGRRDREGDLQVMETILRMLSQEKWQDAVERMRKCGALYIWGYSMLKFLLTHREYRHFITPLFLRKNLQHVAKLMLKRVTPAPVGNWYLRRAGYRAKSAKTSAASSNHPA